jgi:hypothetical protein
MQQNAQACDAALGFGEFGKINGQDIKTKFANQVGASHMIGSDAHAGVNKSHISPPRLLARTTNVRWHCSIFGDGTWVMAIILPRVSRKRLQLSH